jgi:hypothetical protein
MRWILVVALLISSCSSKSNSGSGSAAASAASKFTLVEQGNEANKVNVEMAVPAAWQVDASQPRAWKMDGAYMLALVLVDAGGDDNASRLDRVIKMQFDKDAKVTRNDYPDGRAFIWETQPNGKLHARMFVPSAKGIVMGVAMGLDKTKLDGVKAAFETLKIVP